MINAQEKSGPQCNGNVVVEPEALKGHARNLTRVTVEALLYGGTIQNSSQLLCRTDETGPEVLYGFTTFIGRRSSLTFTLRSFFIGSFGQ